MTYFNNLDGVLCDRVLALYIESGADLKLVLHNGCAATAAGSRGAINVWRRDDGTIVCELCVLCVVKERKIYKSLRGAIGWTDAALLKIKIEKS